jgi:hypothetical protein
MKTETIKALEKAQIELINIEDPFTMGPSKLEILFGMIATAITCVAFL